LSRIPIRAKSSPPQAIRDINKPSRHQQTNFNQQTTSHSTLSNSVERIMAPPKGMKPKRKSNTPVPGGPDSKKTKGTHPDSPTTPHKRAGPVSDTHQPMPEPQQYVNETAMNLFRQVSVLWPCIVVSDG
jgi:hypothetical protein